MEEKLKKLKELFSSCKREEDIFSLDVSLRKEEDGKSPEPFPIMGREGKIIGIAIKHFILAGSILEYWECFLPSGETMAQKENSNMFPAFWIKKK